MQLLVNKAIRYEQGICFLVQEFVFGLSLLGAD